MSVIDGLMVVAALTAALWWALSRRRRPAALELLSVAALVLAVTTLAIDGVQWQLVPWQVLALAVTVAAALRRWRPGHSRRCEPSSNADAARACSAPTSPPNGW